METNGKPKGVQITPDLVPEVEAVMQKIKTDHYLEPSFAEVVNMLVREALEARKALS
ncbi:MAG: hypothetical protein KKB38_20930 [Gammaproteobacteria bacterium]|nr:hypothetical protein [Gammaproteobacteria bacterium]